MRLPRSTNTSFGKHAGWLGILVLLSFSGGLAACADGDPPGNGTTDCTDGDTDIIACGANDDGEQARICVDGQWENDGACIPPGGACDAGDTQTIDCGLNDRGTQEQECDAGQWTNTGTCDNDDVCLDDDTRNADCGTNGIIEQKCVTGQWEDTGACQESCVDGETSTTSCGINDNGTQDLICDSGNWVEDGACDDPDECLLEEIRNVDCGPSGIYGAITQECQSGADGADWEDTSSCIVTSIDMQENHACAVRNTGNVDCWGKNNLGQLGDGTTTDSAAPVEVQNIQTATHVAVGATFSCALVEAGDVYCWGSNSYGQLGNGTDDNSSAPVKVDGLTNVRSIAAGFIHACAIDENKDAYCWGSNTEGQLGVDSTTDRWTPEKVKNLPDVWKIVAGIGTTCALKSVGGLITNATPTDAYCWGDNSRAAAGHTGSGADENYLVPKKIDGKEFFDIATHRRALCGTVETFQITGTGRTVQCIGGSNVYAPEQGDGDGQAGVYNTFHNTSPMVSYSVLIANFRYPLVKAGGDTNKGNVCATLPPDNELYCWGHNEEGSLGRGYSDADGDLGQIASPEPVKLLTYTLNVEEAQNIKTFAVGENSVCTINARGQLACTGEMSSFMRGYLGPPGEK